MNSLFSILVCVLVSNVYGQLSPVVNTTIGSVQGLLADDGEYFTYYGIPFAGTTAGVNRFREPTPPPIFEEVFMATNSRVICPQPSPNGPIGEENCLVLSVFTNNVTSTNPVMVWLIGEEYTTSLPLQHSFRNLVQEDLVVVAINYRLSVFGFLCLGIAEAAGNAGLRDVVQGLKWIQDNIVAFGGDPNNVVLFGHGSGAAMVDLITLSPLARGLLHKAIYHSGSSLSPWAVSYDPIGSARDLRDAIQENRRGILKKGFRPNRRPIRRPITRPYSNRSRQDLVAMLRGATVYELVNAVSEFEFPNNAVLFAPCIENIELNPNNTFLREAPIKLLESGEYLHIPVIAGYTDIEGSVRADQAVNGQWLKEMDNDFIDFLPPDLELNEDVEEGVTQSIREFYFGYISITISHIQNYFDYHGDTMTVIPVIRSVILRGRTSEAEVRLLEFTYRGSNNSDWEFEDIELNGVPHGGILNYLLDFDLFETSTTARVTLMHRYVNFINTGYPTHGEIVWDPIMRPFQEYLLIAGEKVLPEAYVFIEWRRWQPHSRQHIFWSGLYNNFYRTPLPVTDAANTITLSLIVFISFFITLI